MSSKSLFIKLRAFGDSILLSASIEALHRAHSKSVIDLILPEPWIPLYERDPRVRALYPWPEKRNRKGFKAASRFLREVRFLRSQHYEAVYNFHASPSSALIARMSGAPLRSIHFHGLDQQDRHTTVVNPGKGQVKPAIERDLDVLRAAGLEVPVGGYETKLYVGDDEVQSVRDEFGAKLREPTLIVVPGGSRPSRQWPLERFAELSRKWVERTGGSVIVSGSREEEKYQAEFASSCVFAFGWPLRKLMALYKLGQVFAGNDSGPKHLAAALGVPTLTFFGPSDPVEWHPYDQKKHAILRIPELACRRTAPPGYPPWCGVWVCETEGHRCMLELEVPQALKACLRVGGIEP